MRQGLCLAAISTINTVQLRALAYVIASWQAPLHDSLQHRWNTKRPGLGANVKDCIVSRCAYLHRRAAHLRCLGQMIIRAEVALQHQQQPAQTVAESGERRRSQQHRVLEQQEQSQRRHDLVRHTDRSHDRPSSSRHSVHAKA